MYCVQCLDHEEGSAARWFELRNSRFESRDDARAFARKCRETDDEYCLYSYRVTEVGSPHYYSQPTDSGEY